jgi:ribonuclease R
MSDLVNHWIVYQNEVPENLVELCDRASERQKAGEQCEREYENVLEELSLDPDAVKNRGIEIVESD